MPDIDSLSIRISSDASAAVSGLDKLATTLAKIGRISGSATGSLSKTSKSISSMRNVVSGINKTMTGLTKGISGAVTVLSYIPKKLASPFVKAVGKMGSAVMGLGRQIARVAMYRALRTAIKLITQAFSEGITNLYKWSSVFDKTFYKAMNTIATAKTYFSNSMAAMASPLIEAFTPAVDAVIDKFVEMFNIVNQFLSRIVGKDTYTAARKVKQVWDDVDEDTDNTTQKVKELRKTLLGFDEINRLDKDTSESTSSNSNKKPPDTSYLYMFEERPIEGAIASFADKIKEAIQGADWDGLGKILGNCFNSLIDKIDFAGWGRKLGNSINAVFETLYWFLITADFSRVGSGIATFLNNALSTINFKMIGRTMVRWFTSGIDALIAFLMEFDFGQLARGLSDFVIGLCDEIYDWFANYDDWGSIGETIGYNIADAIASIKYGEVWNALSNAVDIAVESIIKAVTGAVTGISDRFKEAMNWDELPNDVKKTILAIEGLAGIAGFAVGAVLTFSGANIGLGLALMVASGLLLATAYEEKWGDLKKKVDDYITGIKFFLSSMGFAVGAVLAFGGFNIPLGVGLMIASGALGSTNAKEAWDTIENSVGKAMFAADALVGTFKLTLGVLALITKNYGVGLALIASGAAILVHGTATGFDFGKVGNIMRQILPPVEALIGGFELTLGILAIIGKKYLVGIGLIASGAATLATAGFTGYNFDGPKNMLTNVLSKAELAVGLFTLTLGIIACIAQKWPIGIGLIVGGLEATSIGAAQYDWDSLKNKFDEVMGSTKVNLLRGAGMVVIGALLCATSFWVLGLPMLVLGLAQVGYGASQINWGALGKQIVDKFNAVKDELFSGKNIAMDAVLGVFFCLIGLIPFGIGFLLAGLIGLGYQATQVDWGALGTKIKKHAGEAVDWLKEKGKLVLGILAIVGGKIGSGIAAVAADITESWSDARENWQGLVELGEKAINKVQEGWNKFNKFTVNVGANISKKLENILRWLGVDLGDGIQNSPNEGGYSPQHYGEGSVSGTGRDHNVIMKMSATPGNGFIYGQNGQLRPNVPYNIGVGATLGPVYTDTGERVDYKQPLNAMGLSNLKTNVGVGVNPVWKLIANGFMLFMGLVNLSTTVGVKTSTAWGTQHKTFLNYLDVVGKTTNVNVNATRGNFKNGLKAWIGYDTHTVTVNLARGNWYWGLSDWIGQEVWVRVNLWAGGGVVYGNGYSVGFASGGVITRSGWNHLDKAANGGTRPHGTMFVAGEAGPEIVGHIGGRTEILNKSQLASTMFASVSAALSPAVKVITSMGAMFAQAANEAMNTSIYTVDRAYARMDTFAGSAAMMENATAESMVEMLEVMRMSADATMEQNRLLQQQNDLLRQINEKDFNPEISTAAINKAQQRSNRRAGVTVVSVGG